MARLRHALDARAGSVLRPVEALAPTDGNDVTSGSSRETARQAGSQLPAGPGFGTGRSTAPTPPALLVREGPEAGRRYPIESEVVVGRVRADVTVPDPEVSRRHATIRRADGGLEIDDLGSENGTSVNGKRIRERTRLVTGDTVTIGRTTFVVEGFPRGHASTRSASPARTPTLRFLDGSLAGRRFPVPSECVLGRQADITVADPGVSRRHAAIRPAGDALEVRDLGSANGTWVNGDRLEGARRVLAGDLIKIGHTTIEICGPGDGQTTLRSDERS